MIRCDNRQQTGRWHRRQNKFAKVGEPTEATVRLVVSYFHWILVRASPEKYCGTKGRVGVHRSLELEWPDYLSHTLLMHYQKYLIITSFSSTSDYINSWKLIAHGLRLR